jgi:hypothetical protein
MTDIPTDFSLGLWSEPKEQTIDDLKQQLAECQQKLEMAEAVIAGDGALIAGLKDDLAGCQAREVVLRDAVKDYHQFRPTDISVKALALPSGSTALDELKRQWQREVLLEAAERFNCIGTFRVRDELRRMANEME